MSKGKTNVEMCEIVTLRREKRELQERNGELTKVLSRAAREIETLCSQYNDAGSNHILNKIQSVLKEG